MKKIFSNILLLLLGGIFCLNAAEPYQVTLKIIDETKSVTKGSGTKKNAIVELDAALKAQNPRSSDGWWYPMYAHDTVKPDGLYSESDNDITWEITLNAVPGTYTWTPYLQSLGWKKLHTSYPYAQDAAISFTVNENGTTDGTTVLVIPKETPSYTITLKVIDETKTVSQGNGSTLNKNVMASLGSTLKAQNPRSSEDWWFPMYDHDSVTPDGIYTENDDNITWEIALNAKPGTYTWTPYMQSLGWKYLNNAYHYAEDPVITFSVYADGTTDGKNILVIPKEIPTFDITLKVIDKTKGALSSSTVYSENNVVAWISGDLNTSGNWFYGFYSGDSRYPNGELIKTEEAWIWQATFNAKAGAYEWNPCMRSLGPSSADPKTINGNIPNAPHIAWEGSNLSFSVGTNGELSGDYELILEEDPTTPIEKTYLTLNVDMNGLTVDAAGVHATGTFNNWSNTATLMHDEDGDGIYTVKIEVTPQNVPYEYKFINGTSWSNVEVVFGECEFRSNRFVVVDESSVEVPAVAFGYCGAEAEEIQALKVACIGSSSTEGAGTSSKMLKSWPIQLRPIIGDAYYTENLGVSGTTQQNIAGQAWKETSQYNYTLQLQPDIILMALGANDSKPQNWNDERFRADYAAMIEEFKALPTHPEIYLCKTAKVRANSYGLNDENMLNGVIPAITDLAKQYMLPVIDYYTPTAPDDMAGLFPDGVHANDNGAKVIAEKVGQVMLEPKPVIGQYSAVPEFDETTDRRYYAFQWYRNGTAIEGAESYCYTATEPGSYNVAVKPYDDAEDVLISQPAEVTLQAGETTVLSLYSKFIDTGIERIGNRRIAISCCEESLTVDGAEESRLVLYTTSGKTVKSTRIYRKNETISLSNLPQGIYLCKIITKEGVYSQKIVR